MKPISFFKSQAVRLFLISMLLLLSLAACGAQQSSGPGAAVEAYLKALIDKDSNAVTNLSCANWEAESRVEYDSFAAVTARIEDMSCEETGRDGDVALVTCTGKIVANYNGEDQDILLSDRTYQAIEEGGDWRMCGYR